MRVAALLLAAGSASRFGSDKLLHRLPHGIPVAVQALRHLRSVFDERILVVVRPETPELSALLRDEGGEVVVCEKAAEGMGASLACAIRAVHAAHASGAVDAYLVALADMPFVRPSSIAAVRDALLGGAALAAPYFRARRGHPAGIASRFRAELERLSGDAGARSLFEAHTAELVKVPVGDPGVIRDIDTPGDLSPPLVV